MTEKIKARRRPITEYQSDPNNANRGNERGREMIVDSFKENGAGRSILSTDDDVIMAGNQSLEAAAAASIKTVIEVETTGDELVVVKRKDVKQGTKKAKRMALADNRDAQANLTFDPARLLEDPDLLEGLWRDDEIAALMEQAEAEAEVNTALSEGGSTGSRLTGERQKQIKPVLYVNEVSIFERALALTGHTNRGQALLMICEDFLERYERGSDEPIN